MPSTNRSVRAEKPLRLMLVPIWLPSAAPIVMPGMLRTAEPSEVAPCDCMIALLITTTDCGMSRTSVAPSRLRLVGGGAKSSLGREPVTVTGVMVAAGAGALGSTGLVALAGSGGGVAAGCRGGGCWAIATGATSRPIMAVFIGTRRFIIALGVHCE